MCGFVGKFGLPDEKIKEAGKIIYHRGRYAKLLNGKDWWLHSMTSILDLSSEQT